MTSQGTAGTESDSKAQQARDHPALEWMAKLGTAIYGVVYVVVGWLAIHVALGDSAGQASGQGALREIAQQPFGEVVLWVACAGFAALALWTICEAAVGHAEKDGAKRVASRLASAGRAIVFIVLGVLSFQIVTGSSSGGGRSSEDTYTAKLLQLPFGPALVVLLGLGIVGYGMYSVYVGLSDRWRKHLDAEGSSGDIGTAITILARTGLPSRGVAFAAIGGLFMWAGFTDEAKKSGGLDQALVTLRDAPFGKFVLIAVAIGLASFGVYNIAKAWYLRQR